MESDPIDLEHQKLLTLLEVFNGRSLLVTPPTAAQIAHLEAHKAQQSRITHIIGLLGKFNGLTFVNVEPQGVRTGAYLFIRDGGQYQQQAANEAVFWMRRVG